MEPLTAHIGEQCAKPGEFRHNKDMELNYKTKGVKQTTTNEENTYKNNKFYAFFILQMHQAEEEDFPESSIVSQTQSS